MLFNLSEKPSIADDFIRQLRDETIQQDAERFRNNLIRLSEILAYELSKKLQYESVEVTTPMGVATCRQLKDKMVLAPILRAGLPMHTGVLRYFGQAENAFIASYRRHHKDGTFEIQNEYATFPDLTDKVLVIIDAMLATGSSIEQAYERLTEDSIPSQTHILSAVAAMQGIERLQRIYPHIHIWTAAIDEELTAKSYIVPGLGDAGDLAYGPKNQE